MSHKRKSRHTKYVNHPRYGDQPVYLGNVFGVEEIEQAYCDYHRSSFFPETAIAADVEKQNYCIYPRTIYVDIEKKCVQCNRPYFLHKSKNIGTKHLGFI